MEEKESKPSTPSSRWHAEGQADPHGTDYDCERAALTLGNLTDDELANAAFLNYDRWPSLEDIVAGKAHPPIAYMTAVKERIRWLSRRLSEATHTAVLKEPTPPVTGYKGDLLERLKDTEQAVDYLEAAIAEGGKVTLLAVMDVLEVHGLVTTRAIMGQALNPN